MKTGLLLINLGTPDSPRPGDVRSYLREFLSDPRVIDLAAWKRWLLVRLILLVRPRRSAEAYAKIWTEEGSPLLVYGRALTDKVRSRLEPRVQVELAMRYGRPSIGQALERFRRQGVNRIVAFPLYPQYSSATTGSSMQKVFEEAAKLWNVPALQLVGPFYDHPAYLDAAALAARSVVERSRPEKLILSFHGLPERHLLRGDPSRAHCLQRPDCCDRIEDVNRDCYRAQCMATARGIGERLGVPPERRVVGFQSRLGREAWIRPYTEEVLAEEARSGCKRAVILSPAFVADCLETLEELGIRGAETWKQHGGETLELAPAPNADDAWADAVVAIARDATRWIDPVGA